MVVQKFIGYHVITGEKVYRIETAMLTDYQTEAGKKVDFKDIRLEKQPTEADLDRVEIKDDGTLEYEGGEPPVSGGPNT